MQCHILEQKRPLVKILVKYEYSVVYLKYCISVNFLVLINVQWLCKMLTSAEAERKVYELWITYNYLKTQGRKKKDQKGNKKKLGENCCSICSHKRLVSKKYF